MALLTRQFGRELSLARRESQFALHSFLFFLIILIFFPLTLPADPNLLRQIAPGVVWTAMLFAFFLSAERVFQQDYDEGVIEQWAVSGYPMQIYVGAKVIVHWLANVIPMLLLCPLVAVLFNLNAHETLFLMVSLIAGTPAIFFLCALAASFSLGLKHKGVLSALILFPLTIPVMIFGSGALIAVMSGMPAYGLIALLAALSLIAIALLPFAIAFIIRLAS